MFNKLYEIVFQSRYKSVNTDRLACGRDCEDCLSCRFYRHKNTKKISYSKIYGDRIVVFDFLTVSERTPPEESLSEIFLLISASAFLPAEGLNVMRER